MQKHSKIRNVPFPRPCGAPGNDAQKLHAPTFSHFRGAAFLHEVLCPEVGLVLLLVLWGSRRIKRSAGGASGQVFIDIAMVFPII